MALVLLGWRNNFGENKLFEQGEQLAD